MAGQTSARPKVAAFEEVQNTETVWLRGSCGDGVFALHVGRPQKSTNNRHNPVAGDEDEVEVQSCDDPSQPRMREHEGGHTNDHVHRSEKQRLGCEFQVIEYRAVAGSMEQVGVPAALLRGATFKTKLYSDTALLSRPELRSRMGFKAESEEELAQYPILSDSELADVATPPSYNFVDTHPEAASNTIRDQGRCGRWALMMSIVLLL